MKQIRNRYLGVSVLLNQGAGMCTQLENEGWEVLGLSAYVEFAPQGAVTVAFVSARIPMDTPHTETELQMEQALARQIIPVKNGQLPKHPGGKK